MPLKTLQSKMKYRISRSKANVFTPRDFFDFADRDQVSRVLRNMIKDGELIKFGQGLFSKARRSKLTGKTMPIKPLPEIAVEALRDKLKVKIATAQDLAKYNKGDSTQVPTGRVIAVKGRVSRKMAYDGKSIKYQYVA
jgi:hypothetical protein